MSEISLIVFLLTSPWNLGNKTFVFDNISMIQKLKLEPRIVLLILVLKIRHSNRTMYAAHGHPFAATSNAILKLYNLKEFDLSLIGKFKIKLNLSGKCQIRVNLKLWCQSPTHADNRQESLHYDDFINIGISCVLMISSLLEIGLSIIFQHSQGILLRSFMLRP